MRQQAALDQAILRDENAALKQQVADLEGAARKAESKARKAARLLQEKEEKYVLNKGIGRGSTEF